KREGWKGVVRKVLKRRQFGIIYNGMKEFIKNYWRVRKVRREVYKYGYGKEGLILGYSMGDVYGKRGH
ncbi:MAG: hypothetical protein NZ934_03525, partial [Hadesarchaea archaeon]|nr:hypothetical protein [Hadesarchaea archaeon]